MANLNDLAHITGQKSISDMTDDELREHLRSTRRSRKETKVSDTKLSEKPTAQSKSTKKKPEPNLDSLLNSMSQEQLALMAKLLGEKKNG